MRVMDPETQHNVELSDDYDDEEESKDSRDLKGAGGEAYGSEEDDESFKDEGSQ